MFLSKIKFINLQIFKTAVEKEGKKELVLAFMFKQGVNVWGFSWVGEGGLNGIIIRRVIVLLQQRHIFIATETTP